MEQLENSYCLSVAFGFFLFPIYAVFFQIRFPFYSAVYFYVVYVIPYHNTLRMNFWLISFQSFSGEEPLLPLALMIWINWRVLLPMRFISFKLQSMKVICIVDRKLIKFKILRDNNVLCTAAWFSIDPSPVYKFFKAV